ncbi:MAG: hypothetical protein ACP5N3_04495 [Candidatus Nanoarchaeia archaeon]
MAKKKTKTAAAKPVVAKQATGKSAPAAKPAAKEDKTMGILGLIINLFIPGLGTLIGFGKEKRTAGVIQLVLVVVSWILIWTVLLLIVGWLLWVAMWIWALVIGIKELQ